MHTPQPIPPSRSEPPTCTRCDGYLNLAWLIKGAEGEFCFDCKDIVRAEVQADAMEGRWDT